VSFVELVLRAILRAFCAPARAGSAGGFLIAFLAALGCADKTFGEIITHLQPIRGCAGVFADTKSYSIAEINAAGGIAIGNNLFDSFSVTPSASKKAASPTETSIQITAVEVNGDYGFRVNALWTASAGQWVDDTMTFHASFSEEAAAQGHAFVGNSLYITAVGGANTEGGIASISENLYRNYPGFGEPSLANEFTYYAGQGDENLRDTATFSPVADLWVVKDIGVSGGTGQRGVMGVSEFYETFDSAPEPSTLVLLGMGAFGMAGFARRNGRSVGRI
jgi:hypothetical protein